MPDNEQFDPANPENKAITDGMERDGEALRDIREGKTPTEQAFGLDLGLSVPEQAEEHDAIFEEVGEVIAQEESRTKVSPPDLSPVAPDNPQITEPDQPVEVESPDIAEPPTGPVAELAAIHGDMMADLSEISGPERKRAARREEMAKKRAEHRLRSVHGEAMVEMGEVVERDSPTPPDEPLSPAAKARIAHPGREKPHEFGEAWANFAHEDKEYRAKLTEVLDEMASHIVQGRLELERILSMLERIRL